MKKNITIDSNNILQGHRSILRHFTDKKRIILLVSLIILLGSISILSSNNFTNNTSALEYQSTSNLEFTINPTVSISVSGDLVISNLSPSSSSDSNIVTVTASSNAIAGYTLYANVGNSTHVSPSFNNTSLNHSDGTNTLTSLSTTDSIPDLSILDVTTNGKWGYSYSLDNGTTWINGTGGNGYSGLPLYSLSTDTELISQPDNTTTNLDFKIGAKANQSQVAGEYTNIINFIALANPNPTYITLDEATYMQDSFSCTATKYGTVKSLIDNRDNQSYLVAKANDGNCWMIENLKIGKTLTESVDSITLTPANSNVNDNYTLNFSDIPTDGKFHAYTIDGTPNQNNSNEWICRTDWDSCYYNWYTATAGAGTTATTSGSVDTSICPAGWSLPTSGNGGQFQALYNQYPSAAQMEVDNPTTTKNNSAGKIPGFLLSGGYNTGGAYSLGSYGVYWSRTAYTVQVAYDLGVNMSSVYPANNNSKYLGFAERCIAN